MMSRFCADRPGKGTSALDPVDLRAKPNAPACGSIALTLVCGNAGADHHHARRPVFGFPASAMARAAAIAFWFRFFHESFVNPRQY